MISFNTNLNNSKEGKQMNRRDFISLGASGAAAAIAGCATSGGVRKDEVYRDLLYFLDERTGE